MAFAEGYHAKERTETDSKNTMSGRAFRLIFYLCLLWLGIQLIQVFTAVGGGESRMFSEDLNSVSYTHIEDGPIPRLESP